MGMWGWLTMLAFWALVVVLIIWAVRAATASPQKSDDKTALQILDERLARGEIDREDYEERRQLLGTRK